MKKQPKIGLFFGSFNPVHIGHMAMANYILEYSSLTEIWFVVSPQNPFKNIKNLLNEYHRLELVRLAIDDKKGYKCCDIEFKLPKPNYTVYTLAYLKERYPKYEFVIIMGGDNLLTFNKWKNYKEIKDNYKIIVYSRPNCDTSDIEISENITVLDCPKIEISSSMIRNAIKEGKDMAFFMPPKAYNFINEMNFYK